MGEHIKTGRAGAIVTLGFDRPEKRNAITPAMYEALGAAFADYAADESARAMVMHGTDEAYTAGNDLSAFAASLPTDREPPALTLIKAIEACEKPVLAAVEGWCVGVGATLLLHTDLVVMGRSARLKMPFAEIGIVPEAGATWMLTRRHGRQVAAELMLLCEPMGAERAYQLGLCNRVTEDGGALAEAMGLAERLAALSPGALSATKRLMREGGGLVPHMDEEVRQIGERLASEEMRARMAALRGR